MPRDKQLDKEKILNYLKGKDKVSISLISKDLDLPYYSLKPNVGIIQELINEKKIESVDSNTTYSYVRLK